jgi:hypothetical protein
LAASQLDDGCGSNQLSTEGIGAEARDLVGLRRDPIGVLLLPQASADSSVPLVETQLPCLMADVRDPTW